MSDRELLELAAKAAGLHLCGYDEASQKYFSATELPIRNMPFMWNSLTDAGDALRLAVKLHIGLEIYNGHVAAVWCDLDRSEEREIQEPCDEIFSGIEAKNSATLRAITRAAAEIGKAMP